MNGDRPSVVARQRARGAGFVAMVFAVALVAAACDRGDEEPPGVDIDASTYVAAIEGFLPTDPDPDDRPVVYVVPVADDALALGTQVAVIDALAETHDVRFVDSPEAAVDEGSADEPARDGGMLLGVGVVSVESPHTIRIEVYEDRDEVAAHLVTVAVRGGLWQAVGDEPVEPEVLVGD